MDLVDRCRRRPDLPRKSGLPELQGIDAGHSALQHYEQGTGFKESDLLDLFIESGRVC